MKRNFLNLMMGTALTLTMVNAAMAMEKDEDSNGSLTKKMKLDEKKETAETLVAGYLTLQDLFSFELTTKAMHSALQNAPQYKALIQGWEDKFLDTDTQSYKEKFLYLQSEVPEYKVHLANLWFNFFPLEGENLKLSHYWEFTGFPAIGQLLGHLNGIYDRYLQSDSQQPEFGRSASLGQAITWSKFDGSQTNQHRLETLDAIYQDVESFSEEQRNTARYNWIEHTVKHALVEPTTPPLSYTADRARTDYKALLDNQHTPPHIQMSVLYHMAELDVKGFDLPQPDLSGAKEKFLTVLAHPKTHPFTKVLAHKYLEGGKQ